MDEQKVSDEEGEEYAKKLGFEFLITSALLSAESFRKFVIELYYWKIFYFSLFVLF